MLSRVLSDYLLALLQTLESHDIDRSKNHECSFRGVAASELCSLLKGCSLTMQLLDTSTQWLEIPATVHEAA
jgi:hypothetical protein